MINSNRNDQNRHDEYTVLGRISPTKEHVVEDARTATRGPLDVQTNGKSKGNRRRGNTKTLVTVLVTILCFSLTLIAADLLSGRSTLSQYVALFTGKADDGSVAFYAVYAMKTEDMALAYKNAASIRAEGGAGYVLKDQEEYYVILNAYYDENDAKKVADREINYDVYTISFPRIDEKSDTFSFTASTEDLFFESYHFLYEAANALAAGNYGKEDMLRSIEKHREKIVASQDLYADSIRGKETTPTLEYKVLLAELRGAFDNLISQSDSLVADARYYSVMILHSYSLYAQKYSK